MRRTNLKVFLVALGLISNSLFAGQCDLDKLIEANSHLKVALVHDWLTGYRGGEKVLEAVAELFPKADIYTLFHTPGSVSASIESHPIKPSFLNRLPNFIRKRYRHLLPLFPMAIESFELSDDYDLVLSTSHAVAKGIIPPAGVPNISYSFTPMRYLWDERGSYFPSPLAKAITLPFLSRLRLWDSSTSYRVTDFIASSKFIASRIKSFYGRDSTSIVYPFVDTAKFTPSEMPPGNYFLTVSALVPYKRVDQAIEAANRTKQNLVVVGSGPDRKKLQRIAGPTVKILGRIEEGELQELYRGAKALIFPGQEDFGISPLEAMASGRPVIAYGRGGASETILNGETGILYGKQTVDSLVEAIDKFGTCQFSSKACRKRAEEFTKIKFQADLFHSIKGILELKSVKSENGEARP